MPRVYINVGGSDSYAEDLRRRLKKHGISQNQLAKKMGVTAGQLSRWFNKPMNPRVESIERIETALLVLVREKERKAAVKKAQQSTRQAGKRANGDSNA